MQSRNLSIEEGETSHSKRRYHPKVKITREEILQSGIQTQLCACVFQGNGLSNVFLSEGKATYFYTYTYFYTTYCLSEGVFRYKITLK